MQRILIRTLLILSFLLVIFSAPSMMDNLLEKQLVEKVHETNRSVKQDRSLEVTSNSVIKEETSILGKEGIHNLIGKDIHDVKATYGKPDRIDLSAYDYHWWIYENAYDAGYIQIGILNEKVVTIYCLGDHLPTVPFQIGDSYDQINKIAPLLEEVSLNVNHNSYQFQLTREELMARPLVKVGTVYIQLYFDTFTNKLSGIRYLDGETLVKQRPYSVVYRGELILPNELTEEEWRIVERGSSLQIFSISNVIRQRHQLQPFIWDEETSMVAFQHSQDMMMNDYFSHTSPTFGELKDRLKKQGILYQLAGENIAAKYVDAIAAVEGWLNSEGHRVNLLHDEFTHLGVGVYERYYTQNFITPW